MVRPLSRFAAAVALLLLVPLAAQAQSGVDLIPDDATAAFVINSIAGVRDKGEKFIKEYDLQFPEENRPSSQFKRIFEDFLGIKKGLDDKGAAAIVLPSLKKNKFAALDFGILSLLYFVVPVADVEEMASNYGLKKGDLKPGKIVPVEGRNAPLFGKATHYLLLKDKHLYVGLGEKALALVPEGKPVTGELLGEQKKALTNSDLALHLGADALGRLFSQALDTLEQNMKRADDADNSQSKQFVDALRQTRFVVGGLSLDNGGKINIVMSFNKGKEGEAAAKWLTALRAGPGASDLIGLPAANAWIGYAAKGDGVSNVAMVRALINIIFDQNQIETVLPGKERHELVAAFETMYKELKGSRAALYPTKSADKVGKFALAGILDLGDPDTHLAEWSNMVKLLNRAAERAAKDGMRKPPVFAYQPKAESLDGSRVDLLTVKYPDLTAEEEKRLKTQFGPDWSKVRLAVVGKQVAVLMGSDLDLLKETIANLKTGKKGLADNKVMTGEFSRLASERKIEFHFNLRNLRLSSQGKEAEPVKGMTSFAITIETDRLQLEIVAAKSEVRPFAAFLGLADD